MAASPAVKADVERYAAQLLEKNYKADGPGAAVLVARGDEILFRGARGLADVNAEDAAEARRRVPHRLGQQAVLRGRPAQAGGGGQGLAVRPAVASSCPISPMAQHITVLELLNHTSGVKSYTGMPDLMAGPIDKDLTTAQLIAIFKEAKVDFAPGEGWAYNNSGYVLVGAVIEAVSGKPWHQYLRAGAVRAARHDPYRSTAANPLPSPARSPAGRATATRPWLRAR